MQTDDPPRPRRRCPPGAILPGDPGYDEARISFNGILDRRPAVIVPCDTTDEVVAAVRAARAAGLPIAIRGGGHSVAGHSMADGALVVSLATMRDGPVDPDARLAHAGRRRALGRHRRGRIRPRAGGDRRDVRRHRHRRADAGRRDRLADARRRSDLRQPRRGRGRHGRRLGRHRRADGDRELLWALRGGGGNFGVVTRFTYRLTPVGPMAADGSSTTAGRRGRCLRPGPASSSTSFPTARCPRSGSTRTRRGARDHLPARDRRRLATRSRSCDLLRRDLPSLGTSSVRRPTSSSSAGRHPAVWAPSLLEGPLSAIWIAAVFGRLVDAAASDAASATRSSFSRRSPVPAD